jgi:hypothetical protein
MENVDLTPEETVYATAVNRGPEIRQPLRIPVKLNHEFLDVISVDRTQSSI